MKNARHWEIYSVMNSTNNAFMAIDKYPLKKKPKCHMLEPNNPPRKPNTLFLSHTCAVNTSVGK